MTLVERESSRILVVDDDRAMRLLMRHKLERDGYVVEEAADGGSAIAMFQRTSPDIVLMDASMPEMDGFTACSEIRKLPGGQTTPVLIVTSLDDDGSIADAFRAGATDYLSKPLHWTVLRHRLRRVIGESRAQKRIDHIAHHDSLTGLPNRMLVLDRLERALARARRYKEMVAVVNLDLDGFKHINDTMGHETGDALLMEVAGRLAHLTRKSDTVARFGGDEFVLLVSTASERGVSVVRTTHPRCAVQTFPPRAQGRLDHHERWRGALPDGRRRHADAPHARRYGHVPREATGGQRLSVLRPGHGGPDLDVPGHREHVASCAGVRRALDPVSAGRRQHHDGGCGGRGHRPLAAARPGIAVRHRACVVSRDQRSDHHVAGRGCWSGSVATSPIGSDRVVRLSASR